jgi:hypothetical protein
LDNSFGRSWVRVRITYREFRKNIELTFR